MAFDRNELDPREALVRRPRIGRMHEQRRHAAVEYVRATLRAQGRVEHDAQRGRNALLIDVRVRVRVVVRPPHGQARVVGEHRAAAAQDRAAARAPALHIGARRLGRDPFRTAIGKRGAAIEAHRELEANPRPATFDTREEATIQLTRRVAHQAGLDHEARRAQAVECSAIALRHVLARDHRASDAGRDQRIRAWRRTPMQAAGFERDVRGRATGVGGGCAQGEHFRVRTARLPVPSFADHAIAVRDHAADARIRPRGGEAALGKTQRARHQRVVA